MTTITYSQNITLVVSRFCPNRCLYCGFFRDQVDLIEMDMVKEIFLNLEQKQDALDLKSHKTVQNQNFKPKEVLIMSGERPERSQLFVDRLQKNGFTSLIQYVIEICKLALVSKLLPHVNIGVLNQEELQLLRPFCASMGLMLENLDFDFGRQVHPQKDIATRIEMIKTAGELKIPFTSGILIGMWESRESRFDSLERLLDIHRQYGHLQEIIIQSYKPNQNSRLPLTIPLNDEEILELISYVSDYRLKHHLSGPAVQIPPNLIEWSPSFWQKMITAGVSDLGGIAIDPDQINPQSPWPTVKDLQKYLRQIGCHLKERLAVYPQYINQTWLSKSVYELIKANYYQTVDS